MRVILWPQAVQSSRCPCRPYREVDTYCLSNGEHFPAGRVDWNKTWRQQLLLLRVVASAGVKQLINTNLNRRRVITVKSKAEIYLVGFMRFHPVKVLSFNATYLAEMVPVEWQCCLRSQLEKMELCSENLLSSGNRRQVEPVLHLFTAHCNEILSLESRTVQQHLISYSSQEQTGACTSPILHLSKKLRTVFPSRRYGSLVTPSTSATVLYKSSMYCGGCLCPWIAGGSSIPKTSKSLLMAAERTSSDSFSTVNRFSR